MTLCANLGAWIVLVGTGPLPLLNLNPNPTICMVHVTRSTYCTHRDVLSRIVQQALC